ncbi:SUKH-4 family immunity protein [Streptomyces platensis]|uniref:SUKH-4 family immunity protein n=1 Tax=Streptomyces platensis TaxID=58346 RepID=UPI003863F468|nr:SUKH-4 family immunity protein [Streptomyces platensis]
MAIRRGRKGWPPPESPCPGERPRRYLTDIGLPALYGRLYFATLAAIDETGLFPADWPAEAAIPPNGNGPFFLIGTWVGSGAYLDGATGRVIQDGLSGGSTEPVIAGSLRQYVSLLWLCRAAQLSAFPTAAEERDAQRSARKWAAHVDPIVDDSATWKAILSGSLESDLTAGGWELPGLKPA